MVHFNSLVFWLYRKKKRCVCYDHERIKFLKVRFIDIVLDFCLVSSIFFFVLLVSRSIQVIIIILKWKLIFSIYSNKYWLCGCGNPIHVLFIKCWSKKKIQYQSNSITFNTLFFLVNTFFFIWGCHHQSWSIDFNRGKMGGGFSFFFFVHLK